MAISITYNSDVLALYLTFCSTKQTDLAESLAWLIVDEKSMGISEEQSNLIIQLAQFYFEIIGTLRTNINSDWTYLDWLTQDEYDKIMYKRTVLDY